jgi:hypothetical protein
MMTSVTPALAVTVINVQVVFVNLATLPTSLLLPMRLVQYNGGNRKLTISAESGVLPQAIAEWLQSSPQYREMIGAIGAIGAIE